MGTSLRIYPSQAEHLLDNHGSHWTGTVYAEMELLLLMHPSFEAWKEQHDHAESLGVHSVPCLRLGPRTFVDWFSRTHWDNLARDLLKLSPKRQGNDPRICFDAELYLDNQQEPTEANSVSHGGLSALEQAMQQFLDVVENEGIKPAIHPIAPDNLEPIRKPITRVRYEA
jgi:hypothetical protein